MAASVADMVTVELTCTSAPPLLCSTARTSLSPADSATDACQVWNWSVLVAGDPLTSTAATFWPSVVPRALTVELVVAPELGKVIGGAAGGGGGAGGPSSALWAWGTRVAAWAGGGGVDDDGLSTAASVPAVPAVPALPPAPDGFTPGGTISALPMQPLP